MKLIGTGSALPKKKVTNAMLSEFLDTSDEWIIPRTGIRSRHVISDENLEDHGAEAASKALEMAGLKPEDIDYFICSNSGQVISKGKITLNEIVLPATQKSKGSYILMIKNGNKKYSVIFFKQ